MEKIITLNSIDDYNHLFGFETFNPLVGVYDLSQARHPENFVAEMEWRYGVYAVFLKHTMCGDITYGHTRYDYSEGTVTSFAPGQVAHSKTDKPGVMPKNYALMFSPELVHGTPLGHSMKNYSFFNYTSHEALHLSERERAEFKACLDRIQAEVERPIDRHSRKLICSNIELLLENCLRFYDRQFITRQDQNLDVLARFEKELNDYFARREHYPEGLPTVKYFAERCFLSPNYFGDLIKKETGRTPQDYIQDRVINLAKDMLRGSATPVGEIAYQLGFGYSQHFNRYFKKLVGMTPTQYRLKSAI